MAKSEMGMAANIGESKPSQRRPSSRRIYVLFGLLAIAIAYAVVSTVRAGSWHVPPEAASWTNPLPNEANLTEARQMYSDKCAHCHGQNGKGDGADAGNYDPRPTNFSDPALAKEPDGVLFFKLSEGKRPMPSFRRKLTEYQRWELVKLIRWFSAQGSTPAK
jgi:mono/diheme cytochrome c family protein